MIFWIVYLQYDRDSYNTISFYVFECCENWNGLVLLLQAINLIFVLKKVLLEYIKLSYYFFTRCLTSHETQTILTFPYQFHSKTESRTNLCTDFVHGTSISNTPGRIGIRDAWEGDKGIRRGILQKNWISKSRITKNAIKRLDFQSYQSMITHIWFYHITRIS